MNAPTRTVRAFFEALNDHDADRAAQHVDPAYHGVDATRSALTVSREEARDEIRAGLTAFPDAVFTVEQCVAEPPYVSVYWTMEATHEASFLNLPTTHRPVSVSGTGLFTVEDKRTACYSPGPVESNGDALPSSRSGRSPAERISPARLQRCTA